MIGRKKEPFQKNSKNATIKDFFDLITPSAVKFMADHFIFGDTYRCVWAIREYPPATSEQALLSRFGEKENVTLHVYSRSVYAAEQRKIIQNAQRKNRLLSTSEDLQESVKAEGNIDDVARLISDMRKTKEPLLHCAVYIELSADSREKLYSLQAEAAMELTREKITFDRLILRQKEGLMSVNPCGYNALDIQFERVLPASSVANLYPLNYSGKTDPKGFYIGRDRYGTNVIADFDRRDADKTNGNVLILGNSGQGKSYLLKLLLTNLREAGKSVICLDAEQEYETLTEKLGGCYIDLMSGKYIINPLEPRAWTDDEADGEGAPEAFRRSTILSQHISFLKDFFRSYKDFTDTHIDAIEMLLSRLYDGFGITDNTDFSMWKPKDYPVMADLFDLAKKEYLEYMRGTKSLYTEDLLREICLGLNSMCKGAESKFFNGYTNISDGRFICFGVKGLMDSNKKLKDAMLFNILSFINNKLLTHGNAVASIDELYLFLTNMTAIEYIRNASKRVRKKDSSIILSSQNIEDFLIPGIREYTKPLFSIPTHQFLFNPGNIDPKEYIDALQLESSEYDLIRHPERGTCLFKCGNERYLLQVKAPEYKAVLFGQAGGR